MLLRQGSRPLICCCVLVGAGRNPGRMLGVRAWGRVGGVGRPQLPRAHHPGHQLSLCSPPWQDKGLHEEKGQIFLFFGPPASETLPASIKLVTWGHRELWMSGDGVRSSRTPSGGREGAVGPPTLGRPGHDCLDIYQELLISWARATCSQGPHAFPSRV